MTDHDEDPTTRLLAPDGPGRVAYDFWERFCGRCTRPAPEGDEQYATDHLIYPGTFCDYAVIRAILGTTTGMATRVDYPSLDLAYVYCPTESPAGTEFNGAQDVYGLAQAITLAFDKTFPGNKWRVLGVGDRLDPELA